MSASRRVIVIGASAAGLRCACRLARLEPHTTVTVLEAREVFSYAACGLPYVLGGDIPTEEALRRTAWGRLRDADYFREAKRVDVRPGWRALEIDPIDARVTVQPPGRPPERLAYDDLVLATGARARRLPGQPQGHARVCSVHVLEDIEPLRQGLAHGELNHVAIVGAGLVGCELAEAFHALWGAEVTLLEAAAASLPGVLDVELGGVVARRLEAAGIAVRCGTRVAAIDPSDSGVAVYAGAGDTVADAVIVAVGAEPAVDLACRAGVASGATGAIAVDDRLATNLDRVWAAGDCVEVRDAISREAVYLPLGGLANRQGRVLADVLAGRLTRFPPVAGAVAVRVFDLNVAAVGWTRARADRGGVLARSAWITADDRPRYWPEAAEVRMSVTYEPGSRRVLGVQAAGSGDVTKRIDVATQVVLRAGTLEDLGAIEHAYAPPYAPAVDPLALLAWTASNQEDGVEAEAPDSPLDGRAVLDVRGPAERAQAPVPARTPADAAALAEDACAAGGSALVVCARGARSAEDVRTLNAQGVQARYLGGGLAFCGLAPEGPRT